MHPFDVLIEDASLTTFMIGKESGDEKLQDKYKKRNKNGAD